MRDPFGLRHPFFRPVWRRVLVAGICLGWALFEFATGNPFWGILFGALGFYAAKVFFVDAAADETGKDDEK